MKRTSTVPYLSGVKRIVCMLFVLLGAYTATLHAQFSLADSILRQLQTMPADTHRVLALVEYAWELTESNPDEAEARLTEAVELAKRFNFRRGEAKALNGLGVLEDDRNNKTAALEYHQKALSIRQQLGIKLDIAASFNNLGALYESLGNYDQAIENHRHSLQLLEEARDSARMARANINLAGVYEAKGVYITSYNYLKNARFILEAGGNRADLAEVYTATGHLRFELEEFADAQKWYYQALHIYQQLKDSSGIANSFFNLGNAFDEFGNLTDKIDTVRRSIPYYFTALELFGRQGDSLGIAAVYNNLGVVHKHLRQFQRGMQYLQKSMEIRQRYEDQAGIMETNNSIGDIYYEQKNYQHALLYTQKYYDIAITIGDTKFEQKAYKDFAKIYAALGDYQKAFEFRVKYDELRYERLNENRAQEFNRSEITYEEERRKQELEQQKIQLALNAAEISRFHATRNGLIGGGVALMLLIGFLYARSRAREQSNRQLAAKNAVIEREKHRADELLMNILPEAAALELKQHNSVRPVRYDSVTVLFTDFKGFTSIAEEVSPEELIEELDECFRLFDAIVEEYGLEKIKTIGDSYMCAGGLPIANTTHATDTVRAAVAMQRALIALMNQKAAEGKPVFEMRIGIHTGPVVAGVVGSRKFAYDIWGDTVNTASRLEQGSAPHKINISGTTYQHVRDVFTCTYRGEILAKNKGEIAMYFVEY